MSDHVDPVAFFRDVAARHRRCFWLDGGGAREWSGRRSIIGWLDPDAVSVSYDAARRVVSLHDGSGTRQVGDDVFAVLEEMVDAGEQWFGYLGHAARPDLPALVGDPGDPARVPDAVWMRASHVRMFDHPPSYGSSPQRCVRRVPGEENRPPPPLPGRKSPHAPLPERPDWYGAAFARVQEHLHAGNSYEVNLTYRLEQDSDLDPVTAYLRLRDLNPAPYAGFLQHDVPGARAWLLSSSPERYALITPDRLIETKPIKGTTPRGADPKSDEALRRRLATDPKTRAENLMIVDLLRNDLSMVCEPGSVAVPVLMDVESYESVHQLVSTVRGRLRDGVTTVGALRALFPAGSMTGAPKLRTMEIIDEVEATPRGAYAGAFGWIGGDGGADLGVVIRSLVTAGSGRWLLGTGGGITVRSDVDEEWAESRWKAERLLRVFD